MMSTRRSFLTLTGAAAATALSPGLLGVSRSGAAAPGSRLPGYPFRLGIASGDPLPDAVVIWTRLAIDPFAPFGGMEYTRFPVQWQVAEDELFSRVVKEGATFARPEKTHTVHVDVRGLRPGRDYFYRFRAGRHLSPVGRTKTAPPVGAPLASLTFAFASCQSWTAGYYTAYEDMARHDHDLIVHLGDYVYEYGVEPQNARNDADLPFQLTYPNIRETETLDEYRNQYALYKADPHLQAAHASAPWITTIDDHEVADNWASRFDRDGQPWEQFLIRRANAFRAHWEHMPMRPPQKPIGPDMRVYRRFTFGDLAQFSLLDTRQYRSQIAEPDSPEWQDPSRTMTGAQQEAWLLDGLGASQQRWNVIGQQNHMSRIDIRDGEGQRFNMDSWAGYPASRDRILTGAYQRDVRNLVSIGGDIHRSVASDLKLDFDNPDSPNVGVEFTGTSISSGGNGADLDSTGQRYLDENPHIKFYNNQRGYVRCTVTPQTWESEFRVADFVEDPGGKLSVRTRLVVQDGQPRIQTA